MVFSRSLPQNGENSGRLKGRAGERGIKMPREVQKITVEIFGEKHIVRGEATPEYIHTLAHEVDKKMRLIAQRLPLLSANQIAVLAALNFADELAKLREEQETLMQLLGEKTE